MFSITNWFIVIGSAADVRASICQANIRLLVMEN